MSINILFISQDIYFSIIDQLISNKNYLNSFPKYLNEKKKIIVFQKNFFFYFSNILNLFLITALIFPTIGA